MSSAIQSNTLGEQRTLLILINFQDKPTTQPFTLNSARFVFDRTSQFFWENSYQRTWLTGDVVGYYTIALNSSVCDTSQIASLAKQAATTAGVNVSAYRRYVYVFPKNSCGWLGSATFGGFEAWINEGLSQTACSGPFRPLNSELIRLLVSVSWRPPNSEQSGHPFGARILST